MPPIWWLVMGANALVGVVLAVIDALGGGSWGFGMGGGGFFPMRGMWCVAGMGGGGMEEGS